MPSTERQKKQKKRLQKKSRAQPARKCKNSFSQDPSALLDLTEDSGPTEDSKLESWETYPSTPERNQLTEDTCVPKPAAAASNGKLPNERNKGKLVIHIDSSARGGSRVKCLGCSNEFHSDAPTIRFCHIQCYIKHHEQMKQEDNAAARARSRKWEERGKDGTIERKITIS